ncbi:hypothetical protein LTS09_009227 [Friedmanniomyces endolithicus]|nr:hypothetical protein LTS09_009227 [Friedmanniomyces endolithicus]
MGAAMLDNESNEGDGKLPWFRLANPSVQICLISATLFFNPGLYLAVTVGEFQMKTLASALLINHSCWALVADALPQPLWATSRTVSFTGESDSALSTYTSIPKVQNSIFAFSAVAAGPLLNKIGPRWTLMFGITGYPIYQGAMWYFDESGLLWYPIFAGAYLGLSAGCLWTTSVFVATAYPEERDKGRWRSIQWSANVATQRSKSGSAIGAAVALGISWNSKLEGVPHSVYIVFIILQCLSTGFALLVRHPETLRRCDGTALATFDPMSFTDVLKITGGLLVDWRILMLVPCMFAPVSHVLLDVEVSIHSLITRKEMFFPFQASMNAYAFNLRTRVLNSMLNNLIQIPAALFLGWILDNERLGSRKRRAFIGITFDACWIVSTYIAQTAWLAAWKFDRSVPGPMIDCTDPAYAGAIVIYMLYAAQYGIFQNMVIYVLGTLTNEPRKTAAIGGLFVGVLSAGTAVSFGVDATAQPYENENAAYFALSTICWPILYYVVWKCTTDTNYLTEEGVIAPVHVRKELALEGITEVSEANEAGTIGREKRDTIKDGAEGV